VPRLVPELDVASLQRSLAFYVDVLGFTLVFQRPEEKFARLAREGAELMLEEAAGPGRRFRIASLEYPFGRGINLQIEVDDVEVLHARVAAAGTTFAVALEDRWYRRDAKEYGKRQFVIADPDGYLLCFFSSLGTRPVS
jgi:catechol 2,3-dioxygenase-like lactoylglutathione lyase family enzyme